MKIMTQHRDRGPGKAPQLIARWMGSRLVVPLDRSIPRDEAHHCAAMRMLRKLRLPGSIDRTETAPNGYVHHATIEWPA
jgi:hypothetical protein